MYPKSLSVCCQWCCQTEKYICVSSLYEFTTTNTDTEYALLPAITLYVFRSDTDTASAGARRCVCARDCVSCVGGRRGSGTSRRV